jgi:sec-independent protein translocase protein TatB
MLFDLGWSEILLVGVVALVFIGPKDLPKALRVAGFWVRKARNLSREFQSSIDQMIRESELDEMRQDLKKASEFDLQQEFHNTIEPSVNLARGAKPDEAPSPSEPPLLAVPAAEESVGATPPSQAGRPDREALEPGSAEPAEGAATPCLGEPAVGFARDSAPPRP